MIKGSVYLVTGGSSGLGEAAVEMLLAEGANVAVLDLQPPIDKVFDRFGDQFIFLQVNVTSGDAVSKALKTIKEKFGKLNGVVNCAGIVDDSQPVFDFETRKAYNLGVFSKILNVNLTGTFNVIRLAVPLLCDNEPNEDGQRGVIINTSSIAGQECMDLCLAYTASKAAIIALSYPLAKQLSEYGIRVMDIAPGLSDTPLLRKTIEKDPAYNVPNLFPKRWVQPNEFAKLVKHIIENPMLNGSSIRLDGATKML